MKLNRKIRKTLDYFSIRFELISNIAVEVRFLGSKRKILKKIWEKLGNFSKKTGEKLKTFLGNITVNLGNWVNYH